MAQIDRWTIAAALVGLASLAALIGISVEIARGQALKQHRERVQELADEVLERTERTRQRVETVFSALKASGTEPCSSSNRALMRAVAIDVRIAGAGYVVGDELRCSSWGSHGSAVPVGPSDYRSTVGTEMRLERELSIAPGTRLLLTTHASGYTALISTGEAVAITEDDLLVTLAVLSRSTGRILTTRGTPRPEWASWARDSVDERGTRITDTHVVAWRRSITGDFAAYAAMPAAEVDREAARLALVLTPIGLVAGWALILAGYLAMQRNGSMQALLRAGLRRGEIVVHYQPIVDLRTGQWVGAEALARWRRPGGEWVSPDIFIPIAERHGLMQQITTRIMYIALAEMAPTLRQRADFFVSLNMTGSDLRSPEISSALSDLLNRLGIAPASVHLELTEREIVDTDEARQAITELRSAGHSVAADDFGVGYSNLGYLESLHLDCIKIDRVFLAGASESEPGKQTIAHIIELAHGRGITVIAEGVETAEQAEFLRARGVALAQGWLFSRALPIEEFERAHQPNRGYRPPATSNKAPVT